MIINKLPRGSILLLLIMSFNTGCMVWRVPTLKDQERALQFIDQGVVALRQGELEAAEISFRLAQELYNLPAASDGLGCVAFLRGDSALAEEFFNDALDLDFGYTEAYGNLALLYEQKGDIEMAAEQYQKAIELDPGNYRIRNNYAIFLAETRGGDSQEIRSMLLKAALLTPALLTPAPVVESNLRELAERGN